MSDELAVHLTKVINAPLEPVFNAWLSAETLSKFMLPAPGMPEPRVEADGREGGEFTIYMMVGDEEIPHRGKYLEVQPHSRLVFTWESPYSPPGSEVTIAFSVVGDNKTQIDFSHVKFLNEEARNNHEGGWTLILDKLDQLLA